MKNIVYTHFIYECKWCAVGCVAQLCECGKKFYWKLQSFNLEMFMASKSMVSTVTENVILCCCHKPSGP